jgi:hypothetical protein
MKLAGHLGKHETLSNALQLGQKTAWIRHMLDHVASVNKVEAVVGKW